MGLGANFRTHAMKLPVRSFCADVPEEVGNLQLLSQQSVADFYIACASTLVYLSL